MNCLIVYFTSQQYPFHKFHH